MNKNSNKDLSDQLREFCYSKDATERLSVEFLIKFLLKVEQEFTDYLIDKNSRWISKTNREALIKDLLNPEQKDNYYKLKEALIIMNKQLPVTETLIKLDDDEIDQIKMIDEEEKRNDPENVEGNLFFIIKFRNSKR